MQQVAGLQRMAHAALEGLVVQLAVVSGMRAREDGVLPQQRVELAGHESRERFDAPARDAHPFAVRAGQHEQAVVAGPASPARRTPASPRRASRRARRRVRSSGPGTMAMRPGSTHASRARRCRRTRGAGAVGRFHPALAAAHHAAEQEERARDAARQSAARLMRTPAGIRPRRHGEDAARQRALFEHAAVASIQQRGPQRRGAPVEARPAVSFNGCPAARRRRACPPGSPGRRLRRPAARGRRTASSSRTSAAARAPSTAPGACASSSSLMCSWMRRFGTSSSIMSPFCTTASGPPAAASGAVCSTTVP